MAPAKSVLREFLCCGEKFKFAANEFIVQTIKKQEKYPAGGNEGNCTINRTVYPENIHQKLCTLRADRRVKAGLHQIGEYVETKLFGFQYHVNSGDIACAVAGVIGDHNACKAVQLDKYHNTGDTDNILRKGVQGRKILLSHPL